MDFNKRVVYVILGCASLCVFIWMVSGLTERKLRLKPRSAVPTTSAPKEIQSSSVVVSEQVASTPTAVSAWGSGGDPVAFKKPDEVRALLGSPDAEQEQEDRIVWYYHREQNGYQGLPLCAEIHFMGGEVRANVHYPCETMPDKLATARLVPKPRQVPPRTQRFTQEEFNTLVVGKTKDQIRLALGEPEILHIVQGKEVWQYQGIVQVAEGSYLSYAIAFEGDLAFEIQGG